MITKCKGSSTVTIKDQSELQSVEIINSMINIYFENCIIEVLHIDKSNLDNIVFGKNVVIDRFVVDKCFGHCSRIPEPNADFQ